MTSPYSIRGGYWAPTGMARQFVDGRRMTYKVIYRWHFYYENPRS